MTGISTTHHILDTIVSLVSIVFNLRLFELVWNHSDFKIKAYKWILLITCVGDMFLSVVVLIGQPAIFLGDGYVVAVANGFFATKSPTFDHFCVSIYCALLHANITCVVIQFVIRYRLICGHGNPFGNPLLFVVPLVWCLLQGLDAIWCFVVDNNDQLRQAGIKVLRDYNWHFDNTSIPYPSVSSGAELKTPLHHIFYMITLVFGYGTIIWTEYRIIAYFNKYGASFRKSTRKAHAEVNRAVIALAITPLFTSMGPTLFVVGSMCFGLDQSLSMVFVFVSMGMTFITLANPITTIYFVKPYRRAFLDSIGLERKENSVASSTQNNSKIASNEAAPGNKENIKPNI